MMTLSRTFFRCDMLLLTLGGGAYTILPKRQCSFSRSRVKSHNASEVLL